MAHNITESGPFTHLDVVDNELRTPPHVARFQFGSYVGSEHFSVNVDGWYVPVLGEDLYALRELLAELPEEAFVRPAEPVAKPRWTDGDIVRVGHHERTTYIRRNGEWDRHVVDTSGSARVTHFDSSDETVDNLVDLCGYRVIYQQAG